ncbi:MAG: acyl-CoA dehydrogenase [Rhizobiaceae bacterium]|nr:acyl-CoA dehydrogenase [Rhizobiaceae bacterium]
MTDSVIQLRDAFDEGSLDDYVNRARELAPKLKQRANETEELRSLPDETETELHDSGLFRMMQPQRVGGAELDYVALIDVAEELAKADASVAWNVTNLSSHHWMLAMFPPAAQDAVWSTDADALIASSFIFPTGRAQRVDGGYKLNGRWPFSSGVDSSTWNMLAGMVQPDDDTQAAEQRIFLLPKSDYSIIDTWFTTGLKGTGSKDVEVDDVFVPQDMTLAVSDVSGGETPGSDLNPGALYRVPVFALFPFVLSGCAVGNAQACLDDFIANTRQRTSNYNRARLSDFQSTQIKIAEAGAKIDAARQIMRSICIEAMEHARASQIPDLLSKTRYRRDGAFSVRLCTEAVDLLFAASGAGGLFSSGHLQRQFREAHAINAHIAFNFDAAGSNNGRVELGLPSENPTL